VEWRVRRAPANGPKVKKASRFVKRFLCDTHALLFWLLDSKELSKKAKIVLSNPEHQILVSAASIWEIATKVRIGKLPEAAKFAKSPSDWIQKAKFDELPISVRHAQRAGFYAAKHADPFDRMLAAQSEIEKIPLLTRDAALSAFDIERVW
jgi:PIN domain nuclease of toxin-antitoxin system